MITPQDVYEALFAELGHTLAHISTEPRLNLNAVDVDGVIDCDKIAEFLNQKYEKRTGDVR